MRIRNHRLFLASVLFAAAATAIALGASGEGPGGQAATPTSASNPATAADPAPPTLRLPNVAAPTSYALDLTIDPTGPGFHGTIDIDVRVQSKTAVLWLNAKELKVTKATAEQGGRSASPRVLPGGTEFVGLAFDRPLEPGSLALHLAFEGVMDETSTQGLFRQKDGGDWYAFTQFESTDARRAFPCFDEPSYKVPWSVTLRIPKGTSAVSNTLPASDKEEDGGRLRVVRFAKTPPLPSYLVAFAVGPFDYVDAGKAGARKVPIRIVTPRGKASQATYAAQTTGPLLERLEKYFGIPYPYAKLDQLAIPQTVTFGAMENAGLITWSEHILIAPASEETVRFQRVQASINIHEMAHQWFGDLVTLAWWDDVWLNESFATWMADRTLIEWKPEWHEDARRVQDTSNVMYEDVLVSTRKIRQEIASDDDIVNAFDPISYQKGAAVIAMFESWIGEEKFRSGVHAYLAAHANGNATERDFLQSVEAASRPGVAAAFETFLDQPGVPVLDVALECASGGGASLSLTQKRLLPVGSTGSTAETWKVPVCARSDGGGADARDARRCGLLDQASGKLPASAGACGGWLFANDGELGYYRTIYRNDLLTKLLEVADTKLTVSERVGVIRDANALGEAGAIPMAQALAMVPRFGGDPDRDIVSATLRSAADIREHLVPDDLRPHYARFISKVYGARARALGFTAKPGESDDTRLLRYILVAFVAREGDEPQLREEAKKLSLAWLENSKAIASELAGDVLAVAAHFGDADLFDKYVAAARAARERRDRVRLLRALGDFPDPALVRRALALYLTDEFDPREADVAVYTAADANNHPDLVWGFFKEHYDAMLAKAPREIAGNAPSVGGGFCDPAHRKDLADFFQDRIGKLPGGPRTLAQTLETIDLCIALRASQEGSVQEFL
ncbi:MAG TPA: M1 family metallopeptidase, partial [Thermoanaerobaculia bacterium]